MKFFGLAIYLVAASLALALAGCGKKQESSSAKTPDPMMVLPPGTVADLEALDKTLRDYVRAKKVVPKDLNELVTSGFVRSLPSPPPGKKFVITIHPLGYQVILVDQ